MTDVHPFSVICQNPYRVASFASRAHAIAYAKRFGGTPYHWGQPIEEVNTVPKQSSKVGRAECMDAMCHQCPHKNFNAEGRRDCGKYECPLYFFSTNADKEKAELHWRVLKTGNAVGFVPKSKTTEPRELFEAVQHVIVWCYGAVENAPKPLQLQYRDMEAAEQRAQQVEAQAPESSGW